ncbi:MAG: DUF2610 domain-containing protein [Rickettsiales bacterium]|nr:DUF2610 domain-containing protein [Rickettsiales bacterium]
MVKKFTANCNFGGQVAPVTLYVGNPSKGNHPLAFQSKWLSSERGGTIPSNIMESFAKLSDIADKNKVPFEDLCAYVIDEIQANKSLETDANRAQELSGQNTENHERHEE